MVTLGFKEPVLFPACLLLSQELPHLIDRNGEDPVSKRAGVFIASCEAEDLQEDGLRDVTGIGAVVNQVQNRLIDRRIVPGKEGIEGLYPPHRRTVSAAGDP